MSFVEWNYATLTCFPAWFRMPQPCFSLQSAVAEGQHKWTQPCLQRSFIHRPREPVGQECVWAARVFHHFGKLLFSFHVTKMDPCFFRNSLGGRGHATSRKWKSASAEWDEVMWQPCLSVRHCGTKGTNTEFRWTVGFYCLEADQTLNNSVSVRVSQQQWYQITRAHQRLLRIWVMEEKNNCRLWSFQLNYDKDNHINITRTLMQPFTAVNDNSQKFPS